MQKRTSASRKPPVEATASHSDQPISFVVITLLESKFLANITTQTTTVRESLKKNSIKRISKIKTIHSINKLQITNEQCTSNQNF